MLPCGLPLIKSQYPSLKQSKEKPGLEIRKNTVEKKNAVTWNMDLNINEALEEIETTETQTMVLCAQPWELNKSKR